MLQQRFRNLNPCSHGYDRQGRNHIFSSYHGSERDQHRFREHLERDSVSSISLSLLDPSFTVRAKQ